MGRNVDALMINGSHKRVFLSALGTKKKDFWHECGGNVEVYFLISYTQKKKYNNDNHLEKLHAIKSVSVAELQRHIKIPWSLSPIKQIAVFSLTRPGGVNRPCAVMERLGEIIQHVLSALLVDSLCSF